MKRSHKTFSFVMGEIWPSAGILAGRSGGSGPLCEKFNTIVRQQIQKRCWLSHIDLLYLYCQEGNRWLEVGPILVWKNFFGKIEITSWHYHRNVIQYNCQGDRVKGGSQNPKWVRIPKLTSLKHSPWQKNIKKHKKDIDKLERVWYNIDTVKSADGKWVVGSGTS